MPIDQVEPFSVMIVDDSTVIRGLITRALEQDPNIKVVASVSDGQMAVNTLEKNRTPIEVIVLDIEMPIMTGIEAIPKLLAVNPHVKIVMASTLTLKNAEISMQALELGAADYVPKPTSTKEMTGAEDFKIELINKVKTLGYLARRAMGGRATALHMPEVSARATAIHVSAPASKPAPTAVTLRDGAIAKPDVIAIGSSTGGPQALFNVMKQLKGLPQPIVITQHMPPTFTTILAQHITNQCGVPCFEAVNGMKLEAGKAYLAPGDFHMVFTGVALDCRIALNQNAPENFCRPAVDPMLRSLADIFGKRLLVAILTGMGNDGAKGGQTVVDHGGTVIAQDEASSVVWGMPGAAAKAGVCSAVLPLDEMGQWIRNQALKTG